MIRLSSRFITPNSIIKNRPLTNDELFNVVPSVFSEGKHESRSDKYTYIPTITLIEKIRQEGFEPFYACQQRVRDDERAGHAKHMIRFRKNHQISDSEVPEILLLNSHDGSSSYKMIPGIFRFVCLNGMVCGDSFGEIRVRHKGDVVDKVIEGTYEIVNQFDSILESRDEMKSIYLNEDEKIKFAETALEFRYDGKHIPVSPSVILDARREEDRNDDLWTVYQRVQENIIKGGKYGRTKNGSFSRTIAINNIDGNIKNNRFLWSLAEEMKDLKS